MDRQCGRQLYDRTCCAKQMWERLRPPMNTKQPLARNPQALRSAPGSCPGAPTLGAGGAPCQGLGLPRGGWERGHRPSDPSKPPLCSVAGPRPAWGAALGFLPSPSGGLLGPANTCGGSPLAQPRLPTSPRPGPDGLRSRSLPPLPHPSLLPRSLQSRRTASQVPSASAASPGSSPAPLPAHATPLTPPPAPLSSLATSAQSPPPRGRLLRPISSGSSTCCLFPFPHLRSPPCTCLRPSPALGAWGWRGSERHERRRLAPLLPSCPLPAHLPLFLWQTGGVLLRARAISPQAKGWREGGGEQEGDQGETLRAAPAPPPVAWGVPAQPTARPSPGPKGPLAARGPVSGSPRSQASSKEDGG